MTIDLSFDEKILVMMAVKSDILKVQDLADAVGVSKETKLALNKQLVELRSALAKMQA